MDDLITERSFDSQATEVIDELGLFFDMLSISACTTRHWSTGAGIKCLYYIMYMWEWIRARLDPQPLPAARYVTTYFHYHIQFL